MSSSYTSANVHFNFTSKFFKYKSASNQASANSTPKIKTPAKEIGKSSCLVWFTKVLNKEDRVLVCSTVDREIVKILQKM